MSKGEGPYNVIAIGAGAGGLVTTAAVSSLGGRAALIEKGKMGGDCLNYGCVPSKGLIASTRLLQRIRNAEKLGIASTNFHVDFDGIFASMRSRRSIIEHHDSVERFEGLGVDVFQGEARFKSPHEVEVNGQVLSGKNIVIAAGSRAAIPEIDGIDGVPYFTNETIFDNLESKPESIAIIGGGPIGSELGQVFARLGVTTTIIDHNKCILSREDEDVAKLAAEALQEEGVKLTLGSQIKSTAKTDRGVAITLEDGRIIEAEKLLIAAGRTPNIEKLNLEAAGVQANKRGIIVNDYLQSSQRHIYAVGDITGGYQFTHVSDYHARTVVRNIMMPVQALRSKVDYTALPWATYIEPEVARTGLNEKEATAQNVAYDIFCVDYKDLDRPIVDREDRGFVKILTGKGTDKIIGATIVGNHAGELIHEVAVALKHGIGLGKLAYTIHAYPTYSELIRRAGDAYNKTRLTPRAARIFKWLFARQLNS